MWLLFLHCNPLSFIGMRKTITVSLITMTYCVEPKFDNRCIIELIDLRSNWKAVLFFISILFISFSGACIHICILKKMKLSVFTDTLKIVAFLIYNPSQLLASKLLLRATDLQLSFLKIQNLSAIVNLYNYTDNLHALRIQPIYFQNPSLILHRGSCDLNLSDLQHRELRILSTLRTSW